MKVFAAALIGLCLFMGTVTAQAPWPGPPPVTSPEILPDGRVTFRLLAPDATGVSVTGDWPGGIDRTTTPMVKDDKGVWSATVGPLKPGFWIYTFTVNGVTTLDPRNINMRRNTNRIENTLRIVRAGPSPACLSAPPRPFTRPSTTSSCSHGSQPSVEAIPSCLAPPSTSRRRRMPRA